MRRLGLVLFLASVCLTASMVPGHALAKSRGQQSQSIDWQQRDTAVYVVSTLNLLRTKDGHSLVTTFTRTLDVSHFDVYSDVADAGLYFVVLRRDDGSSAGELAYQMGWSKPRSTTPSMARLGISTAPFKVVQESKTDPRHKIGSFTSTLPA